MALSQFGMIGLAVMGRNLALNVLDHGFSVSVWNLESDATDKFVAENGGKDLVGTKTFAEFVASLARPRRIMMMIMAGKPVDQVLTQLKPLLEPGDIVIDGGNTLFQETRRREADLRELGLNFVGSGVSGGEEGARRGPSLMPGGSKEAWTAIKPIFEAISAKSDTGACVTHVGPDGAGHYVKMVHNGIEYGDMQLIAEAYDVLHRGLGLSPGEIGDVFGEWNTGPLESFLIELTAKVLKVSDPETGNPLVDMVLDKAGQKGTGKWTAQIALDLGVPIPTIAAALDGRVLSSMKAERVAAGALIRGPQAGAQTVDRQATVAAVHDAMLAAKVCSYAQGMALIKAGSDEYKWGINLGEIGRVWTGGCIIRARLLKQLRDAYAGAEQPANLLVAPAFEEMLHAAQPGWRRALFFAQGQGIPMPAFSASLAYFDSYRTARLPQNITQAQRDAFGAHTYERTDRPGQAVHTSWLS